jgi:hypothetical protein
MIKTVLKRPEEFVEQTFQPIFVGFMQISVALSTELVNLYIICLQKNTLDTIINFVAL